MGIYTPVVFDSFIKSKHTVHINMENVTGGRLACPSRVGKNCRVFFKRHVVLYIRLI